MQVQEWMNRDVVTVAPDESFRTAMHLIRQKGIRHLPVVEGKRLVGIVTDRDLRQASPSGATSLSIHELHYILEKVTVREIMTKQVVTRLRPSRRSSIWYPAPRIAVSAAVHTASRLAG